MSDTPRTDSEERIVYSEGNCGMGEDYGEKVVDSDFARKLERTCTMLVNNRDTANEIVIACMEAAGIDRRTSFEADRLPALIQQIREERDRLLANTRDVARPGGNLNPKQ